MKRKLSVTVEEDIIAQLEKKVDGRLFRNSGHIIEYALQEWVEKKK